MSHSGGGAPTWTEPPWSGWIETTGDALLILEAARRGLIPRVTRRLVDSERKMITSGSVFVFDEDESGIKRWTDGFFWSPSRILGNFLLYRETDKRGAGHGSRARRSTDEDAEGGESLSRPRSEGAAAGVDRHRERTLVGSLTNSYKFKADGLMKKTFSLTIAGVAQHLISYYKIADVESGRLRAPSSLPELASLDIAPALLDKAHFRCPPKTEIGLDGIARYRGEADEVLAAGLDLGLGVGVGSGGVGLVGIGSGSGNAKSPVVKAERKQPANATASGSGLGREVVPADDPPPLNAKRQHSASAKRYDPAKRPKTAASNPASDTHAAMPAPASLPYPPPPASSSSLAAAAAAYAATYASAASSNASTNPNSASTSASNTNPTRSTTGQPQVPQYAFYYPPPLHGGQLPLTAPTHTQAPGAAAQQSPASPVQQSQAQQAAPAGQVAQLQGQPQYAYAAYPWAYYAPHLGHPPHAAHPHPVPGPAHPSHPGNAPTSGGGGGGEWTTWAAASAVSATADGDTNARAAGGGAGGDDGGEDGEQGDDDMGQRGTGGGGGGAGVRAGVGEGG
ncbi:Gti1/Pac2 family-domain-containing protein [Mycena sp. CBHHK59/15]|nr:Gti1/Pac2 family-domain-containing protein [Mycena sp. CBHHK59/15]